MVEESNVRDSGGSFSVLRAMGQIATEIDKQVYVYEEQVMQWIKEENMMRSQDNRVCINLSLFFVCIAIFAALTYVRMRSSYRKVYKFFEQSDKACKSVSCRFPACDDPVVGMSAGRIACNYPSLR